MSLKIVGTALSLVGWLPVVGQVAPAPKPQDPKPAESLSFNDEMDLFLLLNTPITTASKVAERAGDAPASVVVVTAEQIRLRGYTSLKDVFRDLPDFKVETHADPEWNTDVTVRGVPGHDKFVILLNGQRISAPTNEQIPLLENYPVHLAKQIEVVYGPASALYGADAVSGVVNIITRDLKGEGEASLGADKDGRQLMNFLWGWRSREGVQLTLAGQWGVDPRKDLDRTWSDFKGFSAQRTNAFPTIFGPMSTTDYDREPNHHTRNQAVFASLSTETFRFTFFRNQSKTPSATSYRPDSAIYNEDAFIGHGLTAIGLTHTVGVGDWSLQSSVSLGQYQLNPNSNFRNAFTGMGRGYKYAESSSFKAEEQVVWTLTSDVKLTGGISLERFQATPWSTDLAQPVDTSKAVGGKILGTPFDADFFTLKYSNAGAFVQGQFTVSKSVVATLGLRYDDNSRYGSSTNPRLGVVWHLTDKQTLKALYGSAFLAPSPYMAYAHFGSFYPDGKGSWKSSFWRLPNPGLQPIKEKSLELSYRGFFTGGFSVSATLFRSDLNNLYALVPDKGFTNLYNGSYKGFPVDFIEVRTNLGKQYNLGGTLQVDYLKVMGDHKRLQAYVSWSRVDGKVDPGSNGKEFDIPQVAPSILRLGLDLQLGAFSLAPRLQVVGSQRVVNQKPDGSRFTLDGYRVLDLHARYRVNRSIEGFLQVSNTLDAKFRNINVHAFAAFNPIEFDGAPQDPRRMMLGLTCRF